MASNRLIMGLVPLKVKGTRMPRGSDSCIMRLRGQIHNWVIDQHTKRTVYGSAVNLIRYSRDDDTHGHTSQRDPHWDKDQTFLLTDLTADNGTQDHRNTPNSTETTKLLSQLALEYMIR